MSCNVDVGKLGVDSLHVKKTTPMSQCEMKVNSGLKEEVTLTSKADMSFQDCLPEDVQITAKSSIGKPPHSRPWQQFPVMESVLLFERMGAVHSEVLIEVCFSISMSSPRRLSEDPFPPGDSHAPGLLPRPSEQRDLDTQSSPPDYSGTEESRGIHEAVPPWSAVQRQRSC